MNVSAALALIFSATSAVSAALSAWAAVGLRGDAAKDRAVTQRTQPSSGARRISRRFAALVFVSIASAGACLVFLLAAVLDDDTIVHDPLLEAVIPQRFERTCTPSEAPPGAVASITCHPAGPVGEARYTLFADAGSMHRAVTSLARAHALPAGDCGVNSFALERYGVRGRGNWGELTCYVDGSEARIDWTNEDLHILASASAPRSADNDLYRWWRSAGPSPTANLKSFPTTWEQELVDHIPDSKQQKCRRAYWTDSNPLASVLCSPEGVDKAGYALFDDGKEMRRSFEKRLGPASGVQLACSSAGRHGDSSYNSHGRPAGRLVCYLNDGAAYVEWTSTRFLITAYATRSDGELGSLFRWWQRAAAFK